MASQSSHPTSRTVVIPASSTALAIAARMKYPSSRARGSPPLSSGGGPNPGFRVMSLLRTCMWASISPGTTVAPARSRAPSGADSRSRSVETITPFSTTRVRGSRPKSVEPSARRTLLRTRRALLTRENSLVGWACAGRAGSGGGEGEASGLGCPDCADPEARGHDAGGDQGDGVDPVGGHAYWQQEGSDGGADAAERHADSGGGGPD